MILKVRPSIIACMRKSNKIIFLCKRNIVRSYFAEVIFSALYPNFQFVSAGLISHESNQDFSWRSSFLANWGFDDPGRNPKSFASLEDELVDGDVIVLLDTDLPDLLSRYFSINSSIVVLNAFNQLPDWAFTFDPFNMGASDVELAVSRVLFTSHKLLWKILNLPNSNATTAFWESTECFLDEIDSFCENELSKGRSLFFLHPISREYILSNIEHTYLFDLTENQIPISATPVIWMPEFEVMFSHRQLLSKSWLATFHDMTRLSPVTVIAGPLKYGDVYLSAPLLSGNLTYNFEVSSGPRNDLRTPKA